MKNIGNILLLFVTMGVDCYAQNYNTNVNQNQNTIIVNNQPVIERIQYIEKYRTVYVDRPQPKRYARTLQSPVCLVGNIWIYIEDLGDFRSQSDAWEIIQHLNQQGACGRNNWRIPSPAELTLMEKNADKIGLGDGIYLATSHKNGILRPVSTGPSIQEQRAAQYAEEQRIAEEQRKAANVKRARQQAQQKIINSGQGISDGYLIWATSNIGASSPYDKGNICSSYYPQGGWRLPSTTELSAFLEKATLTQRPHNGYLRKVYTYNNIVLIGGRYLTSDGYYDVGTNDGLTEVKGYVRLVQLEE
jgi:hypothetical protein